MVATLIYTISVDGLPFRKDLLTPWMVATLIDFYINVVAIAVWISNKETCWINALVWIILLVCLGSITTCGYVVLQLFKLSAQDCVDPLYHILIRSSNKNGGENKCGLSVRSARVLFGILGLLMLGTLIYTLLTDGSPFRSELLTPWMTALLVDFYINVTALSVWVAYKESSWISALIWILLLICFGSITTCVYIVRQLFYLSSQDPVHLVLVNSSNRQV